MFENTQLALPRLNGEASEVEGRKLHSVVGRWRAYRTKVKYVGCGASTSFALINKLLVQLNRANRY
ncbi:hypothetical protein ACWGPO_16580 [Achromobacter animicus]